MKYNYIKRLKKDFFRYLVTKRNLQSKIIYTLSNNSNRAKANKYSYRMMKEMF